MSQHVIKFFIGKTHDSIQADQNPVTGAYLRALAPAVPEDYDLWLRGRGNEDDMLISPEESVEVREGDHFFTIKREIINGGGTK